MNTSEVIRAWRTILAGRAPSISIEITKECPLRCPGCYAFVPAYLGGTVQLRELSDFKGEELVRRVLALVDRHKSLHVSLVGGDPLVRYQEVEQLLPQLEARGVHTQLVTSAFRTIPTEWNRYKHLNVVISVDELPAEHDERRKPATYERILKNIKGPEVTIHWTITSQIADRRGYLENFLRFWCDWPEVKKVWFSLFTPQRGPKDPEILTPAQRVAVMKELYRLRQRYSLLDIPDAVIAEIDKLPRNPSECIFAQTTAVFSADLKTSNTPCQFGGDPDCEQCGWIAFTGLAAVGHHRVLGPLTAGHIFGGSERVERLWKRLSKKELSEAEATERSPFKIL